MKKLIIVACFMLIAGSGQLLAQITVNGKVTSASDGTPIPGASVIEKGNSTNGVNTNMNGEYRIEVPSDATLVFSFVGMTRLEEPVNNRQTVNVTMRSESKALDEVVVVGYGSQSKKLISGSVSELSGEAIEDVPVNNVDQLMQGRVSGVHVQSNSGAPGGGISVRVRGASSISASNQPLYIVDGVPINTGDYSQQEGLGGQDLNAVSDLNASDIASIQVLKDASYASMYGARAANGVVLIKTKQGSKGDIRVNAKVKSGFQEVSNKIDLLDAGQYTEVMREAVTNSYNDGYLSEGMYDLYLNYFGVAPGTEIQHNTNWLDEVLRRASTSNYNLSFSGGNENIKYFASGNYYDQQGIVIGSAYKRASGRLNLKVKGSEKLDFGASLYFSHADNDRVAGDNNIFGPLSNALANPPIEPVYDEDGNYYPTSYANPVAMGKEKKFNVLQNRNISSVYADYQIAKGLKWHSSFNLDVLQIREDAFYPVNIGSYSGSNGYASAGNSDVQKIGTEHTLEYTNSINRTHNFSILGGFSYENNKEYYTYSSGKQFPSNDFQYLGSAGTISGGSSSTTQFKLASFFGRVNYDLNQKYILRASLRADGSSRFGADNRYAYFPAASAAWRVSEEGFMENLPFISDLKLRGSFGITGNNRIGNFSSLALWDASGSYMGNPGLVPVQLENSELKWEKTQTIEGGISLGLLQDRITFDASYYYKYTTDLLLNRPIPSTTGYSVITENIGESSNRGLEFALGARVIDIPDQDIRWSSNFNISANNSRIEKLFQGQPFMQGFVNRYEEGEPFGAFYGYKFKEVNPETGLMEYKDLNDDGSITSDDRMVIGDPNPGFEGGWTNTFEFKGFRLDAFMQFRYGNEIYNGMRYYSDTYFGDNMTTHVLDRWQEPGDQADAPKATLFNNYMKWSSYYLEDGSFVRLKSLTLSYSLPQKLVKKINFRNIRIFATGENLFTWTNYSGFDPELNFEGTSNTIMGTDFYTYPLARTISVGIDVGL